MFKISGLFLKRVFFVIVCIITVSLHTYAQNNKSTDSVPSLNIDQCIAYGLQHHPNILQSGIAISIAKKTNQINLSGWIPQLNASGIIYHYFTLPTSFTENQANPGGPLIPVKAGLHNTATPQLTASETLFNPILLYDAKSAHLLVQQAQQASDSTKINIIASVSSAFYNLLLTLEQISVLTEDTARNSKNLRDTYHQYVGGIVDKTDYKEAYITLNNSKAQLKQQMLNVRPQYAILKQQIGYPPENNFNVSFDTVQMVKQIAMDTAQQLQYGKRIEYQMLETAKSLQEQNVNYYRYSFLPSASVLYSYDYEFENGNSADLFSQAYPYSYLGGSISIPLFTGFARIENLQRSKMQEEIIDLSVVNLKSVIYSQYSTALANYKSNLYDFYIMRDNVAMAKDVYDVVSLQYKQGIVPYLNVITAESDLISSEISYTNALFQVLLTKVDLDKAMGNIH